MIGHINLLADKARIDGVDQPVAGLIAGSPVLDRLGRVLIERPTTNLLPNPSFSGLGRGTLGGRLPGAAIPTSYERSSTQNVDMLDAPAGRFRHRMYRYNGLPTATSVALRTPATPGLTPPDLSRGGIASSGRFGLLSCTPNVAFLQITQAVYVGSSIVRRADMKILPGQRPRKIALWTPVYEGETVQLYWAVTLDTASPTSANDNFEAIVEVWNLQMEAASGTDDVTSYVAGSRTAAQTVTLPTTGPCSVLLETDRGGIWVDGGASLTLPASRSYAVEQIHIRPPLSLAEKNALVESLHPVRYDNGAANLDWVEAGGRNVQIQRPVNAPAFGLATNRRHEVRMEIRPGWVWPNDPPSGNTNQRCEVRPYELLPTSGDVWLSHALYIEPGAPVTSFAILGQFFTNRDPEDNPAIASPTVSQQLLPGDIFRVYTRGDVAAVSTSLPPQNATWSVDPLPRGVWHQIVHKLTFSTTGGGHLQSWLNGTEVYNADTPLGYNNEVGCIFKYGIYKGVSDDTFAVRWANVEVGTADLSDRIANPLPLA